MIVNELKKVKTFEVQNTVPVSLISKYTDIPVVTLRKWHEDHDRLEKARYNAIHNLYLFTLKYDFYLKNYANTSLTFSAMLKKGVIIADSNNILASAKLLLDRSYLAKSNFSLKSVSRKINSDYSLLKRYQKDPNKLETIAWNKVYRLAQAKEVIDIVDAFSTAIFRRTLENDNYSGRH